VSQQRVLELESRMEEKQAHNVELQALVDTLTADLLQRERALQVQALNAESLSRQKQEAEAVATQMALEKSTLKRNLQENTFLIQALEQEVRNSQDLHLQAVEDGAASDRALQTERVERDRERERCRKIQREALHHQLRLESLCQDMIFYIRYCCMRVLDQHCWSMPARLFGS
jgi:hypothetical protein